MYTLGASPGEASGEFETDSLINLRHWRDKPHTVVAPCKRLGPNGVSLARCLVVSQSHVMDLEMHAAKARYAVVV